MQLSKQVRKILAEDPNKRRQVELNIAIKLSRDQSTVRRWFKWDHPEEMEDMRLHTAEALRIISNETGIPESKLLIQ